MRANILAVQPKLVIQWNNPFGLKLKGAGDVAALAFKPIAKAIDAVAGTDLANCQGCAERQAKWNEAVSFQKP
jgi:hypothetical protein